ncbi:F-box domain containing protein [Pandoravirus salinus]|uniref:F-box domain containing protein n=1 Tax=Pandoravirus salinus TaxID=1349410 RepID=S4W0V2_9VIRU|nr:F-box domain [Pandoravirus salinus]AGO83750.1 F-box domain containing protein [Pandoravirus salinus]
MAASLDSMPCEILVHILATLPGPSLAAVGAACRALYSVTSCEDLWRSAYRRDFGCDFPPVAHVDFAVHGKDARWLYALAAVPAGRAWRDPTTRRLCTRLVPADGNTSTSGEFCLVADSKTGDVRLHLDGYGAWTTGDGVVREGVWCKGVFTGPGRVFRPRANNGTGCASTTRCQSFDAKLRAQGRGSKHTDDDNDGVYEGSLHDNEREGFGVYRRPNGPSDYAEWSAGKVCGRTLRVDPNGKTFSGHQTRTGTTQRGVKRNRRGDLKEGRWDNGTAVVWEIARRSFEKQTEKVTSTCGASITKLTANGYVMRFRGTSCRLDMPSGDVVIVDDDDYDEGVDDEGVDDSGLFFVAVSDAHADRCLAGYRFFPSFHSARDGIKPDEPTDAGRGSRPAASDHESHLNQSFALYLDQLDRELDRDKPIGRTIRCPLSAPEIAADDGARIVPSDCIGMPFGRVIPAADGSHAGPMIRCFLTGGLVPASACRVLSSGRAYEDKALDAWRAHKVWRLTDPETGDDLALPNAVLIWRPWMGTVADPSDLAWAIAQARHNYVHDYKIIQDIARFNATTLTRRATAPRQTTRDELRALFIAPIDVARDGGGPMVRGFDGVTMTCIELRHPDWDPRGPWRLGTPDHALPEDVTIGDHERSGVGPLDHLESHGIARVALESPSFLGAHLEGVFFFGHTLCGASFAGARLIGCAFIGCRFKQCVFAGALLVHCCFDDCTRDGGSKALDTDAALAEIQKQGML